MRAARTQVAEGDITTFQVEALVNAAHTTLLGGGGVDGAIHRVAGPALLEECLTLGGCRTCEAKITRGYRLPAKWVIHTVGPVWLGGMQREDELLANCYRNSLRVAVEHAIRSVAFPGISTGAYGFPLERAARIAVGETRKFLETNDSLKNIIFVCYGPEAFEVYNRISGEG